MADVHTRAQRSFNMSRIKGKNTKPEMLVRKFLHANGFRYRLHDKKLPGKPDIVLKKYKTVIFVNGCYWHGHTNCKYFTIPKTRAKWWRDKINVNKRNDEKTINLLRKDRWQVLIIWTCKLKQKKLEKTLNSLKKKFSQNWTIQCKRRKMKTVKSALLSTKIIGVADK